MAIIPDSYHKVVAKHLWLLAMKIKFYTLVGIFINSFEHETIELFINNSISNSNHLLKILLHERLFIQ